MRSSNYELRARIASFRRSSGEVWTIAMRCEPRLSNPELLADEPVSRILCSACPAFRFAPEHVRPTRCGDHSSSPDIAVGVEQPTRGSQRNALSGAAYTGWASPPLLFGLAPRGVFRAPDVATRAVGSYPTFSPLPNALDRKRPALGFAAGLPPRYKHHRRFIFCGTFRSRVPAMRLRAPQGAAPWRYQARCPAVAGSCEFTTTGVRTFLPPASLARSKPAITRLIRR